MEPLVPPGTARRRWDRVIPRGLTSALARNRTRPARPFDYPQAILPSAWIGAVVSAVSILVVWLGDFDKEPLRVTYVAAAFVMLPIVLVMWASISLLQAAYRREAHPLQWVGRQFAARFPMLVLPLMVFPLFLATFTINKSAFPFYTGWGWDRALAYADVWLLGTDAWRITHSFIGPAGTMFLEAVYTVLWGLAFGFIPALVALCTHPRCAGRFFLAMMLTWTVGGLVAATLLASAGPIFAVLSDVGLGAHFAPLHDSLGRLLPANSLVRETQEYLSANANYRHIIRGGGISAMPSMHIATAAIYLFASRRTYLQYIAATFWILIFIGSVHFGYHYLVDGLAGTLIAWGCWQVSNRWFARYDTRVGRR